MENNDWLQHSDHLDSCNWSPDRCTCGRTAALERIEELEADKLRLLAAVDNSEWKGAEHLECATVAEADKALWMKTATRAISDQGKAEAQLALLVDVCQQTLRLFSGNSDLRCINCGGTGYTNRQTRCEACSVDSPRAKLKRDIEYTLANLPAAAMELVEKVKEYDEIMLIAFENHRGNVADHRDRLAEAAKELLEVATLRGDNNLPHPSNDSKLWTARMADAWDGLEAALSPAPKLVECTSLINDIICGECETCLAAAPKPERLLIDHTQGCPFREQRGKCTCEPAPKQEASGENGG